MAVDNMASGSNSFALLAGQQAQQLPVKQEAGSTAALGHGTARDKDVKLSKNLMGLKFMQRAAQKTEPAQHRAAAKAAIKEEQFEATPTAARPAPRCVVVRQDFSLAETISGGGGSSRVSFGAFNKAIDAENGVVPPAAEGTKEEAARTGGGADVSEAEMAAALNECRDASGVAGGGRREDGGAAAASPHGTPQKKVKRGKKKREHRGEGGGDGAAAGPPVGVTGAGKAKRKREPGDAGPPAAPGKVRKAAGGGTHGAASHDASGSTPGAGVPGDSGAKAGPRKSLREQAAAAHKARRQKRQARAAKKDAG